MINELYGLSQSMKKAGVSAPLWHKDYKLIPNATKKKPCIRIVLNDGKVDEIGSVDEEIAKKLRKYGNNQGTFPCLNLPPLYRLEDDKAERIKDLKAEDLNEEKLKELKSWCKTSNWSQKTEQKYSRCLQKAKEMSGFAPDFNSIRVLCDEITKFSDTENFRGKLEEKAFEMLKKHEDVELAKIVLFAKSTKEMGGTENISVAFDSLQLRNGGQPVISEEFVRQMNGYLLKATKKVDDPVEEVVDAFGVKAPIDNSKMPTVKLAGGFDVTLRTMFEKQKCQMRYRKIDAESFPLSGEVRQDLHSALNFLGDGSKENKCWVRIGENELLFAYPTVGVFDDVKSFTDCFLPSEEARAKSFEGASKKLIEELCKGHDSAEDKNSVGMNVFVLKKLDKARTKVVYTRQTSALELEIKCEEWRNGCERNVPPFKEEVQPAMFVMDSVEELNTFWNVDGDDRDSKSSKATESKFLPVKKYHGLELLMGDCFSVDPDLHLAVERATKSATHLGLKSCEKRLKDKKIDEIRRLLSLLGLLLYKKGIRKEKYMTEFSYLYGQLLQVSDNIHLLYCQVVRSGDLPRQLVGGGLYQAAVEVPVKTLNLLSQRIMPYYNWLRTFAAIDDTKEKDEQKVKKIYWARKLVSRYRYIMTLLNNAWNEGTRFNDAEKAKMFIGYIADFVEETNKNTAETVKGGEDE